ncbi:hypothetical protein C0992_006490 [Termitomyces sp. T32_za158]|nr:hypothetical protein C0992_006490 [Termitomyces sp. T32_za158]
MEAELRTLQKEKESGLWFREFSPLTDLDMEEEAGRLRDELREKQREIERITQELFEAKTSHGLAPLNQSCRPITPGMCILELEHNIASRVALIGNLEANLSQLQEKLAAAQRALSERDEQLSTLSSLIRLQTDASQKALDLGQQIIEPHELESLKDRLEPAESSHLADLEYELNERNTLVKTMSQDREKDAVELALLRELLSTVERDNGMLTMRLADSEKLIQKYRSDVAEQQRATEVKIQSQSSVNKELEGKVEVSLSRISALDQEVREAEEELLDLRSSKAADEATIETMKEMFSTHVEKQTQSLAVFNSQIISAKSSPAPQKRRSTRTTAKAPVPFKLT